MTTPVEKTALIYDFDGTLAPDNIQEHSLLEEFLGTTKDAFWAEVGLWKRVHEGS